MNHFLPLSSPPFLFIFNQEAASEQKRIVFKMENMNKLSHILNRRENWVLFPKNFFWRIDYRNKKAMQIGLKSTGLFRFEPKHNVTKL